MRICFITTYFDEYRGGGVVFADLFRSLGPEYEITILSRHVASDPSWQAEIVGGRSSHSYYWLNEWLFANAAWRRFKDLHTAQPFDLVIVNQVMGSAMKHVAEMNIPSLYVIHHPVSVDIECALNRMNTPGSNVKWRLSYGRLATVQQGLVHAFARTLTVSEQAKQRIVDDYKIAEERVTVIHNGIDTDFFRKTKPTESGTILAVGSYQHPRRGFEYLLEAYEALSLKGFRIVDVGRRTDAQDARLQSIKGIVSHGLVEHNVLPDFYSRAAVTISTSLYEGFGLSIAESFACETPVVAFAAGGVIDVMKPIDASLMIEPKNTAALVARVRDLLGDGSVDPHRSSYRAAVVSNFGLARMTQKYRDLFTALSRY